MQDGLTGAGGLTQPKGPVTPCNFLSNLSRNAVARQVAGELHSVTWVVSQFFRCAKRCTKSTQVYFSQRIASIDNTITQCITPPATCLAILQPLYGSFNKGACAHLLYFVPNAEEIAQCNKASTPNLGNLQRYIFNRCETSC